MVILFEDEEFVEKKQNVSYQNDGKPVEYMYLFFIFTFVKSLENIDGIVKEI